MRIYLAVQILNFVDFDSVAMVGLFKYSIIGLLQSGVSIIITSSVAAVLGRLRTSTRISLIVLGSLGSIQDSSFALEFFSRGIYVN